ncbi:MAG: U32 family peptidase [Candidatus Riflebacteria bacterium]|nr:U32 family peptidase [Candidatus Riflebacteria bacterium]
MISKRPELLAPAGDQATFKAALMAGADAVYLGGRRFGARAFASNFDEIGLKWARRVTRSMGRKLYITFNTLVFDHEWSLMEEALDFYETLGPDALIIQDLGVAEALARRGSLIERHLSTQAAWDGLGGEELLKRLGISRIILPRETPLTNIAAIARRSAFDIEVFVHGAMCYSISGRCFWSAALGTRSGNRGTCAQPCRKAYRDCNGEETFAFSPRDLRLIDHISPLIEAGVSCVKIEGRMKEADYVYKVVHAYRNVIDGKMTATEASLELDEAFTRQSHTGFIDSPPRDWRTLDDPGRHGVLIGHTVGTRRPDGLTEVAFCREIHPGDGLSWQQDEKRHGARITWVETSGMPVGHALLRGLPSLPQKTPLSRSDTAGKQPWLTDWNRDWERIHIDLFWSGHEEQPLAVETTFAGHPLRLTTREPLTFSRGSGLEDSILIERFTLIGEQFRARRHVFGALGKGLFVSPSALKKLKRELLDTLSGLEIHIPKTKPSQEKKIPDHVAHSLIEENQKYSHRHHGVIAGHPKTSISSKPRLFIRLWQNIPRPKTAFTPDRWILPFSNDPPVGYEPERLSYWLPPPSDEKDREQLLHILAALPAQEFLCLGWEALSLARDLPQHRFRLDWTFNIVNQAAVRVVGGTGCGITAAREWPSRYPPVNHRIVWPLAINPLVSLSRFPQDREKIGDLLQNNHGDRFFRYEVGTGVTGLFLEGHPTGFPAPAGLDLQLDLAFAPGEAPEKAFSQLELMLASERWKPRRR